MPDSPILVSYKDLAEMLVKDREIHEGFWGFYVRFGLNAGNGNFEIPNQPTRMLPTALVPLVEIGIQRFDQANDLCVDAAKVNPRRRKGSTKRSLGKKK